MNTEPKYFLIVIDAVDFGFAAFSWALSDIPIPGKIIISLLLLTISLSARLQPGFAVHLINITLATFSWVLPDIPLFSKVTIIAVLLVISFIFRIRPIAISTLSVVQYILSAVLVMTFATLESIAIYWIALAVNNVLPILGASVGIDEIFQFGVAHGIAIGLPVALTFLRKDDIDEAVDFGCFLQIVVFIGSMVLYVATGAHSLFTLLGGAAVGPLGMLFLVVIKVSGVNIEGNTVLGIIVLGIGLLVFEIQAAQYTIIGAAIRKLGKHASKQHGLPTI